ncbi:hypothetical protein OBBRIDRAFT_771400 [Obba rivulosa]|uniref:Uncharacterized protein n=1 Tax=Obba rivulosa TaxID=1052685 RepID=A0A8E2DPY6_9APHY|nr:hypothetical protein OBBRIDRAFT_771400 [Obba rivulosa]
MAMSCLRPPRSLRLVRLPPGRTRATRRYSSQNTPPDTRGRSRHAQFYSDLVPGMLPVALLGSAVYLGLRYAQAYLSHEKYLEDAHAKIKALEDEIITLRDAMEREPSLAMESRPSGKSRWSSWWS